jgi:hypothetical protein
MEADPEAAQLIRKYMHFADSAFYSSRRPFLTERPDQKAIQISDRKRAA